MGIINALLARRSSRSFKNREEPVDHTVWILLTEDAPPLGKRVFLARPLVNGDEFAAAAHVPNGPVYCLVDANMAHESNGRCEDYTMYVRLDPEHYNDSKKIEDAQATLRVGGWDESLPVK